MKESKFRNLLILFLLIFNTPFCQSQNKQTELSINNFEFKSIFGSKKGESLDSIVHFSQVNNMYCLLGQGFFKTKRSDNADELLVKWLNEHPNSKVVPVSTLKSQPNITYCWIVDGSENLNIYLVKNGCYPGSTMQRQRTWKEMKREVKKIFRGMKKPKIERHTKDNSYDRFIEELKKAELYAKDNKYGIWKE